MKKLVFATHNPNKLIEVKHILANKYEILDLNDIGFNEEIIEDKKTIIENSIEKVKCVKGKTGFDCFADDTGLEVKALNGMPGVFSKRFAGINANSEDNIDKLLNLSKRGKIIFLSRNVFIDVDHTMNGVKPIINPSQKYFEVKIYFFLIR